MGEGIRLSTRTCREGTKYILLQSKILIQNDIFVLFMRVSIKIKPTSNLDIPVVAASTVSFIDISFLLTPWRSLDFLLLAVSWSKMAEVPAKHTPNTVRG